MVFFLRGLKASFTPFPAGPALLSAVCFLALLVLYSLLRLAFYFINQSFFLDAASADVALAFVYGLRFDVAGLLLLNLPVLLLANVPRLFSRFSSYRIVVAFLFVAFNVLGIALNVADFEYFPTIQRRLLFEPYTNVGDHSFLFEGIFTRYLIAKAGLILGGVAFIAATRFVYRRLQSRVTRKTGWWSEIVSFIFIVLLSVLGIRGGIQYKPLRQANAFFSESKSIGYLTLNSTYTVLRSLFQPTVAQLTFLPADEARSIVHELVGGEHDTFTSEMFPFERRFNSTSTTNRKNVVLFIMESWSAEFCGSLSRDKNCTPFFDSLARSGLLVTRFLANGQRSIESVPSILTSVPGLFDQSIIGSKIEMNRFRGIGSILHEAGYETRFYHGGEVGTMGFDGFASIAGFQKYIGKDAFQPIDETTYDGAWGVCDEPFFQFAAKEFSTMRQPFLNVVFSVSSHDPYYIPPNRRALFPEKSGETPFERSLRYSDFSLKQFFSTARQQPWYSNTIFIITSDHTEFGSRNNVYSMFHIPLLIFDPSNPNGKRFDCVGSHVDLVPTILDLLGMHAIHASMGRSILDSSKSNAAIVKIGPYYGLFQDSLVVVSNFEQPADLFRYLDPKFSNRDNIAPAFRGDAKRRERTLAAYLQLVTYSLAQDRISSGRVAVP